MYHVNAHVARAVPNDRGKQEGVMTEGNFLGPVQVTCYSGRTYADRPASFLWQDRQYEVKEVEKEWQEPGEKHFRVRTKGEKRFELCYHEGQDIWSIAEII